MFPPNYLSDFLSFHATSIRRIQACASVTLVPLILFISNPCGKGLFLKCKITHHQQGFQNLVRLFCCSFNIYTYKVKKTLQDENICLKINLLRTYPSRCKSIKNIKDYLTVVFYLIIYYNPLLDPSQFIIAKIPQFCHFDEGETQVQRS